MTDAPREQSEPKSVPRTHHNTNRRPPHRGVRGGSAPAASMTDAVASGSASRVSPSPCGRGDSNPHALGHQILSPSGGVGSGLDSSVHAGQPLNRIGGDSGLSGAVAV